MNILSLRYSRAIAASLVFLVAAQMSDAAVLPIAPPPTQEQQQQQPAPAQPSGTESPNPATAQRAQSGGQPVPDEPAPGFASRSQDATQSAQAQEPQKPVGTAAGPYTRPTGVAGARPSGAAIAPAKQRRVKAIVISVSLIVAGAAAAGAVVGLSKASPSRP